MYTFTIEGNSLEEFFANLEKAVTTIRTMIPAAISQSTPQVDQQPVNPTQPEMGVPAQNSYAALPITHPSPVAPPVAAATATNVTLAPASLVNSNPTQANPVPAVPSAAPTYTLDALARAGAALAQSGKMQEALALLARYDVQTVNQLKPEQYGSFATELRALGAQV